MKYAILLLIITGFIFGCQKKKKASKNASIEIGNEQNAEVTDRNLVIQSSGFGNTDVEEIDIDGDGTNDVRFKSFISGSPGLGTFNGYKIESMHSNFEIAGTLSNEATWISYDTSYSEHPVTGEIYVMWIENRACTQLDASYSLYQVDNDVLTTTKYSSGSILNKTDYFTDEVKNLLSPGDFSSNPILEYTSNDTLYHSVNNTYNEVCAPASNSFSGYLGVRLTTATEQKLGWIQLSINDGYKIVVNETAIQL